MVLTVEVGGSSTQAIQFEHGDCGMIVPLDQHRTDRWFLAAPGLVEGDRIRGAHHLGWLDVQAHSELGMSFPPILGMNDAAAAALGEWRLRGGPDGTWLYIGLGTGIGAAAVAQGVLIPVEFSHLTSFGPKHCGGCGRVGCLDAQIGGHALATPLSDDDVDAVVDILGAAIRRQDIGIDSVVVGGRMARNHPIIWSRLQGRVKSLVHPSACPDDYKSAAPFGLLHAWRTR